MNPIDNLIFKIRGRLLILSVKIDQWIDKNIRFKE